MSDIHGVSGSASSSTLREFANQSSRRSFTTNNVPADDTVEISELAALLSRLSELPEDRARRIVSIRNSIQEGTYDTDDKLDIAADRLFGELTKQGFDQPASRALIA